MDGRTRSVFLYSQPTIIKQGLLVNTQKQYTFLINCFIEKMAFDPIFYLPILTNTKYSPTIRALEKEFRSSHDLGSAYGQNAIDKALVELHNHFQRIRKKLYGYVANQLSAFLPYVESTALFNAALTHQDEKLILESLLQKEELKKKKDDEKIHFYQSLLHFIETQSIEQREEKREMIRTMFYEKLDHWKLPLVKKALIQLDTRVCQLEKADHIQADYVLSVKLLGKKSRVSFPLYTSKNSLRRMNQYKTGSPMITFINGKVRVTVPFQKKVKQAKYESIVGVDAGITDLLHSSEGKRYGTFSGMSEFYEKVVESKTTQRSKLRSILRRHQKELNSCSNEARREVLKKKIHYISAQLNQDKNLSKCRRQYAHKVEVIINQGVKSFFKDIQEKTVLISMESLDLDQFNRGRKANKRDSSWVRGKLLKKLQSILSWNQLSYIEVDPAYTSKCCPKCWNIDDQNRKGKSFCCTVCNHQDDADLNASHNIAYRATDEEVKKIALVFAYSTYKRHLALKDLFAERHRRYLESANSHMNL